ncbi:MULTISPECIES: glutamate--cysteine ligase [Streptomyces]|uniref:Putative glutamate--cysteine ligase 2 n=1 Tax=Streptomyces flavovirens TaxID=52258 RepID=A0ABV8N0Z5_9ACTN|nr:glutamate--cysteine ligase [Streptomyces sp. MBT51]MBK3593224.1 glutamate--cysteine ligase [Streptomyces sp. MBT51]HBF85838.1 carboxylate--amine ligase [Streptomyces sp.]
MRIVRTVGVEEELLLVDEESGEPQALSTAVLALAERRAEGDSAFEAELHRQQLEFATEPRSSMSELRAEILRWRAEAAASAAEAGATVVALATSPLPVSPTIGTGERYRWLADRFGLTTQEQLTCGCHVHVSVESDEEGVAVLDRIRPWLSVLLALSANSPYWQGQDTCYGSYRSRVWGRWPSAGPVELFGSAQGYHDHVQALLDTEVLRDAGMIYFDARLSDRYPTVEVRVADVCLDAADTALMATLVRGLVETAARAWRAGDAPDPVAVGTLRMAAWQAGRSGLEERLLHPPTMRPRPAAEVVQALLAHVRDALEDSGDLAAAEEGIKALLSRGTGAHVQRELLDRTGSLRKVVAECAARTRG